MILKLLLVAAVILVVYFMFFKQKSVTKKQTKQAKKAEPVNELIQCPTCDVYVEVEEAILSGATYYCSTECINKAS